MKDKKTKSKRRGRKYPRKRTSKKTIAKGKKKKYQIRKKSIRKQYGGEDKKEKNNDIKIVKPLRDDPIVIRYMMLSHDVIEFLPTSRIFKENNLGHYLSMIKLEDLLNIVNKFTDYKKSPKIQQIFNYKSSYLVNKNKITFKYNDIKCENLLLKEKGEYNLKKLFLYILNCNSGERMKEIILKGGSGEYDDDDDGSTDSSFNEKVEDMFDEYRSKYPYDDIERWPDERLREYVKRKLKEKEYEDRKYKLQDRELELKELEYKKEKEKEEEKEKEPSEPRPPQESEPRPPQVSEPSQPKEPIAGPEPVSEPSGPAELPEKEEILTTEEEVEEELDETDEKIDDIDDDIDDIEGSIDTLKEKQKVEEKNTIDKIEMIIDAKKKEKDEKEEKERIAVENLEKERIERQKNIEVKKKGLEEYLDDNKIVNISKNEFALYNVNWFNVCCGIETYDELFELEVIERINEKGLTIDIEDIIDKIKKILEDEGEQKLFYKMIKSRLLDCSEIKEPNIFQNIFTDTIGSFKDCDKREKDSVLYMYNGYRSFLKRKLKISISKLDRVLILIYCETRQELLSRYIALEMLRQKQVDTNNKSNVIDILDNIMEVDKKKIKENDKEIERTKDKEHDDYRENEIEKVREASTMEVLVKEKELKEKRKEKEELEGKKDKLEGKLDNLDPKDINISGMDYEERKKMFEEELKNVEKGDWENFRKDSGNVINSIIDKLNNLSKKDKESVNLQLTPDE